MLVNVRIWVGEWGSFYCVPRVQYSHQKHAHELTYSVCPYLSYVTHQQHKIDEMSYRQQSCFFFLSFPSEQQRNNEMLTNPKQKDPPGAMLQHLPLKVAASSYVTSPQGRQVDSLIAFTRPSHNLAAPNDTIASGHQKTAELHLPGKRGTSRRFTHWALQWQIRESHFISSFHIPPTCSDYIHIQALSDLYGRIWWEKGEQKRMMPVDMKWLWTSVVWPTVLYWTHAQRGNLQYFVTQSPQKFSLKCNHMLRAQGLLMETLEELEMSHTVRPALVMTQNPRQSDDEDAHGY